MNYHHPKRGISKK